MQVIGFLQIRNEIESGHLQRFLAINGPLFDALFIYDDFSDDGTYELASKFATKVIRGESRQFGHELVNKSLLLSEVQAFGNEGDAVLWLDADEVLYCSPDELREIISSAFSLGFDGIELPHINLWRSNDWFRTDDRYDDLRPVRIWRLSNRLSFPHKAGLHQQMHPEGIRAVQQLQAPSVVHFGFASTDLILTKHANYRRHWQSGYALHRLISEHGRILEHISTRENSLGSRFKKLHPFESGTQAPEILSPASWYHLSERALQNLMAIQAKPKVTIVSLIYASVSWLEFQYGELLKIQRDMPMGEVEILFLANDASPEVLAYLVENLIPHEIVSTKKTPGEWFINSVYRAYNLAVKIAKGEYVLLVNSDMAYAPGSLAALMREAAENVFLAGRLVELGIMPTGKYGLEKDFGSIHRKYRRQDFLKYASKIRERRVDDGGLYMPLLVQRAKFLELGGYPEGNLKLGHLQQYLDTGVAIYAKEGEPSVPGDVSLMAKAKMANVAHRTVFDSLTYHFQAGERRERRPRNFSPSGVAVVNDSLSGINGEPVLWGQIVERLKAIGVAVISAEVGFPRTVWSSLTLPLRLFARAQSKLRRGNKPRLVLSNATYQVPLVGPWRNLMVRQDSPVTPGYKLLQRASLKVADQVVANDAEYVASTAGLRTKWQLVPLAEIWWGKPEIRASDPETSKARRVLFVGAFNETKGWQKLKAFIEINPAYHWTLVSKYANDEPGLSVEASKRVEVRRKLSANELKSAYVEADVVVVASPYETQNLVGLEACSQNTPVLTTPTGFLGSFGLGIHKFGVVTNDLDEGFREIFSRLDEFEPRKHIESFGLLDESGWSSWIELVKLELSNSFLVLSEPSYLSKFFSRLAAYGIWLLRKILRNTIVPILVKMKRRFLTL